MENVSNTSTALQRIDNLHFEGRNSQALREVKAYLRQQPQDPDALILKAQVLNSLGSHELACEAARQALRVRECDLNALAEAADALCRLGRFAEALAYVEQALSAYDALPRGSQVSPDRQALREWLQGLHWRALDGIGDHEKALRVAQQGYHADRSMLIHMLHSLVALERFEEAEALCGPDPDSVEYLETLRDIGAAAIEARKYTVAVTYFQRSLAFASLPKDFRVLWDYLQALMCLRRFDELSQVCVHWLERSRARWRPHRRHLQMMLAIAYEAQGMSERAHRCLQELCEGRDIRRCRRLLHGHRVFDETENAMRTLLEAMSPSEPQE